MIHVTGLRNPKSKIQDTRSRNTKPAPCNIDGPVKSQKSDDKVNSFRCKAHKYEGMRRTYWYAGLAALPALGQGAPWPTRVSARAGSQAMTEDAAQRSR